jgi:hypothetical protein
VASKNDMRGREMLSLLSLNWEVVALVPLQKLGVPRIPVKRIVIAMRMILDYSWYDKELLSFISSRI